MSPEELEDCLINDLTEDPEYMPKGSAWGHWFWLFILMLAMFFNGCFDFIGIWLGKF